MLANILINKNILVLIHQIKIFIYKKNRMIQIKIKIRKLINKTKQCKFMSNFKKHQICKKIDFIF